VSTLVTSLVTAALIILSIMLVQPVVAVAMIAMLAGGYGLIYLTVRNRLLRVGHAQSRFAAEQAQIVTETLGAIKEIIVLQVQDYFRDRFERASRSYSVAATHGQFVAQSPRYIMECVAAAGLVGLALVLGGGEAGLGRWLGQLTFLTFAAYRLLPTLQQFFAAIVRIRADQAGLMRIAPDLLRARTIAKITTTQLSMLESRELQDCPRKEIRLNEVSFRYASDGPWALSGVSLSIPAGAAVGIVGANGSGKTTLVDVIGGLLVPEAGQLAVDGQRLDPARRVAWQSRVAYVPQNIFLLDATIAQNVALGIAADEINLERLREALRLAQLNDFVGALPLGFDHVVGERGVQLSGGQRQRIGIARALYREASVLLLDEATSALDGLTERELMTTLRGLRGQYTSVLVAHRMSTVRECDVIFELEHGKLVRSGTYDGMLKSSQAFRHMAGLR
jgi:HlyD family secretion protein